MTLVSNYFGSKEHYKFEYTNPTKFTFYYSRLIPPPKKNEI